VEQRDDPTLKGKPVAVGYPAQRGVVVAVGYEARGFGVRSEMPSTVANWKCAELVFVPPRFDVYCEVSKQVQAIFKDYTPLVEPFSLDEAYLCCTTSRGAPRPLSSMTATLNAACVRPDSAACRIAAKAWTASGAPAAPMSSDSARSNQICACAESSSFAGPGVGAPESSAALADEATTAMRIATMVWVAAILITPATSK
jgi:nucleotidyltransferase/DNA polymerase involved in DNA repair